MTAPGRKRGRPKGTFRPRPEVLVNPSHIPPAPALGSWDDGRPVEHRPEPFVIVTYDPWALGPRYPEGYGEPPPWRVAGKVRRRQAWDCYVRVGQIPNQRQCRLEWLGIRLVSITHLDSRQGAVVIYHRTETGKVECTDPGLARAAFRRAQYLHLTPRRPARWRQRFWRARKKETPQQDT